MGRTIPSFRMLLQEEIASWSSFRKIVPKEEREVFDEMLNQSRLHASAASTTLRLAKFEAVFMSLLFHQFKRLREIIDSLDEIHLTLKKRYEEIGQR